MTNPEPRVARDRLENHLGLASRWADELAHEIKNPFHSMVINLELVKRRAGQGDAAVERAEVVESELHRVHGLIDSLLKLVRPWPATDSVNVGTVFAALLPVFRARAALQHIVFKHEPGDGPAGVPMPPADLALLILNLVDNAMDALRDGETSVGGGAGTSVGEGPGELAGDPAATGPWVRTSVDVEGDAVVIRVADSGPGFPELESDPFDAGVTSRPGRPGLGLAVSRRLVEAAGGTLEVERDGDDGTVLVARLPR